jgi:glyoxylase-like metal-dependent hydrolase (beta-lactamase superfamily II)
MSQRHQSGILVCIAMILFSFNSQAQDSEHRIITNAANAMGGQPALAAVHTLQLRGYGHESYQDGGSEITTEPNAPEKVTNMTAYERTIDVDNGRTQVKARVYRAFVFAAEAMMRGLPINQLLDGDMAFNIAANGEARRQSAETALKRRMDLLSNPLVAIRTALAADSRLDNLRTEDGLVLVDVTPALGQRYTLAINPESNLPHWMRWSVPHENLGEMTLTAEYSAWQWVQGLQLPMSYNVVSDFHDIVMLRLHVDRYLVNPDINNLAAPAVVRNRPAPVPAYTVNAEPVAPGVWLMAGNNGANSVLLEFEDHLTLFELPTNRAWSQAVIDKARETVPGKPLTELIITHHHFDHTGGLRVAIAEGLTVIAQRGNMAWYQALSERQAPNFPDALSRNPQLLKTLPVDDHLRLSDSAMTLDISKLFANGHMAHGIMAYIPEHRLLLQGDLFDLNWETYFWGNTYADNVDYRGLDVERDVPIHGRVTGIKDVRRILSEQQQNARDLCDHVEDAGLSMPGCPLAW